jgi:hypothetical protein
MTKKEYVRPVIEVEEAEMDNQLLAVSITSATSSGLDSGIDLQFDGNGGDQGFAW